MKLLEYRHQQQSIFKPEEILYKTLGFSVALATSSLISAGKGVFVAKGLVPKGAVVSMYPGNGTISTLPRVSYTLINTSSKKKKIPNLTILRVRSRVGNSDFHRFLNPGFEINCL